MKEITAYINKSRVKPAVDAMCAIFAEYPMK